MTWRLAKGLVKLRNEVNAKYPNRSKAADGSIGDDAHKLQGDTSDHNPWFNDAHGIGVVTAYDFTHDPEHGVDIDKLSDELVASRDPRIKYVIANGLIAGPYTGWQWQENTGHYDHLHISVNPDDYDNEADWNIGEGEDMAASQQKVDELTVRLGYNIGLFRQPKAEEIKHWLDLGVTVEQFMRAILVAEEHDSIGKAASINPKDFEELKQPVYVKKKE